MSNPDYIGHRKRIKEKYKRSSFSGWLDYEVLEFALSYSIPRKDTKPIAKELLAKFKSINGVLDADRKDIEKVKGVSGHTALFITLLKDMAILYLEKGLHNKNLLSSPDLVYDYLKASLKGSHNEELKALFLNSRNYLIALETIQIGTIDKSAIYPRKIAERTLYNHASGVIIAHNHPGASLRPSEDDLVVTKIIRDALKAIDVELLDHIIIGGEGYFSFKENNC